MPSVLRVVATFTSESCQLWAVHTGGHVISTQTSTSWSPRQAHTVYNPKLDTKSVLAKALSSGGNTNLGLGLGLGAGFILVRGPDNAPDPKSLCAAQQIHAIATQLLKKGTSEPFGSNLYRQQLKLFAETYNSLYPICSDHTAHVCTATFWSQVASYSWTNGVFPQTLLSCGSHVFARREVAACGRLKRIQLVMGSVQVIVWTFSLAIAR